jgi:hypothetical protein
MSEKRTVILVGELQRRTAHQYVDKAPAGYVVTFAPETRTPEQNAQQWPYLAGFAKQLQWPVNGHMVHMTADEWKDVLTAAFTRETVRLAQGLDGGLVMLGLRTSKFSKKRWPEWMAFLKATAAERGVEPIYAKEQPQAAEAA